MSFNKPYAKLTIDKHNRMAILPELKKIGKTAISAGIHKDAGQQVIDNKGTKLIDIAVQNNYGNEWLMPRTVRFKRNGRWFYIKRDTHIKIPATRFITRILEHKFERERLLANALSSINLVLRGRLKAGAAAKDIGQYMVNSLRRFIDTKKFQPNAALTVEAKGFDKRLFDKGALYNAIDYKISRRGLKK